MGRVTTTLEITNRLDQILVLRNLLPIEQIRTVFLHDVLVSLKTTTLCLPQNVVTQLGLEFCREVDVCTAMGIEKVRTFRDAKISLLGREGTFECLELPEGRNVIIGRIPLTALGIRLDLQNQSLELLPISSTDTYLTIL